MAVQPIDDRDDPVVPQREIVTIPMIYQVALFAVLAAVVFFVVAL